MGGWWDGCWGRTHDRSYQGKAEQDSKEDRMSREADRRRKEVCTYLFRSHPSLPEWQHQPSASRQLQPSALQLLGPAPSGSSSQLVEPSALQLLEPFASLLEPFASSSQLVEPSASQLLEPFASLLEPFAYRRPSWPSLQLCPTRRGRNYKTEKSERFLAKKAESPKIGEKLYINANLKERKPQKD